MAGKQSDERGEQTRSKRTGRFSSGYTDPQLIELLRTVARAARPDDPARVTQRAFDDHAPAVAKRHGWPSPPTARAIQMRLGKTRQKRGWRELVAESLIEGRDPVQHAAFKQRAPHDKSLDESLIYYAARRVAEHLGHTPGPDEYARGHAELVDAEQRRRRGSILEDALPTRGQVEAYAGPAGWDGVIQLAGLPPRERAATLVGLDPATLAWHLYETKLELPRYATQLREYATELRILLRDFKTWKIADVLAELERRRAERGWTTPEGAPPANERLSAAELEALIADATPIPERWTVARALHCLAEYLTEYEHEPGALRQKSYRVAAVGRGWPPPSALHQLSQKHGIPTFAAWLEKARRCRDG